MLDAHTHSTEMRSGLDGGFLFGEADGLHDAVFTVERWKCRGDMQPCRVLHIRLRLLSVDNRVVAWDGRSGRMLPI